MRRHVFVRIVELAAQLLLVVALFGCASSEPRVETSKGGLDLSSFDVVGQGPFSLFGEWAFSQEDALPLDGPPSLGPDPDFLRLPGLWHGSTARGTPLSATGQGVYRLRLRFPDTPIPSLSLLVASPLSVCQVWAEGSLLAATGVPGDNTHSERPGGLFVIADIPSPGPRGEIDVFVRVSNHHNTIGGLGGNIILGSRVRVERLMEGRRIAGAFMVGTLLTLFLYHGALYVARRKEKSNLYFSLICLLWGAAILFNPVTGYIMSVMVPDIPWRMYVTMAILPYGLTIPLLLIFYNSLYRKKFAWIVNVFFLILGLAYTVVVIAYSPCGYGFVPLSYYYITRLAFIYLFVSIVMDIVRHEKDAFYVLTGFIALVFVEFDDFFYKARLIGSADFGPYGVFLFALSTSLFMSARMSKSYCLAEENLELKKELDMRRATEQRMRIMQSRLSGMLDSLDAPLAAVNSSREICFCNQAFATLLGRPVRSMPGQPLRDILADPERPGARFLMDAAGSRGIPPGQTRSFEGVALLGGTGSAIGAALIATSLEIEDEPMLLLIVRQAGGIGAGTTSLTSAAKLLEEIDANRNRLSRLADGLQERASDPAGASTAQGDITALKTLLDLLGEHLLDGGGADRRRAAVRLMNLALGCWSSCTGTSKADLAQQSRIWNVYMEKDGYCRTQTLDKYLSEKTLPSRPRWQDIFATAEFVLANCDPENPACAELAQSLARFRSLS